MQIIEIISTFPPEVFIGRHFLSLSENNLEVSLIALNSKQNNSSIGSSMHKGEMPLKDVHILMNGNNKFQKLFSLRHLLSPHKRIQGKLIDKLLSATVEKLKPDLLHFQMATLAGYFYHIPLALGIPYTLSLRGSDTQVIPFESKEKFEAINGAIRNSSGVHSVCNALWDFAENSFSIPLNDLFHKTIYTTVPLVENIVKKVKSEKITFIAVGRFHWTKAYPNLLLAFNKFCSIHLNTELIIIGDGELQESITYWIRYLQLENNVHLLGNLNHDEFASYVKIADGFIQSSIAEGLSNATAEAMALGCPVFATDVGGTGEIIKDGFNGFLLDPITPKSWVGKMELVYDDKLMRIISINARKTAEEYFSSQKHAQEFKGFFETAIELFNR